MLLSYGEFEEAGADMPVFRFIPPNKEVVQRLIVRAANAKSDKEFVNILNKQ